MVCQLEGKFVNERCVSLSEGLSDEGVDVYSSLLFRDKGACYSVRIVPIAELATPSTHLVEPCLPYVRRAVIHFSTKIAQHLNDGRLRFARDNDEASTAEGFGGSGGSETCVAARGGDDVCFAAVLLVCFLTDRANSCNGG